MMYKFFLTVTLLLSSCSYNEIEVRKKNIQPDKVNKLSLYANKKLDAEFRKEKAKINKKYIIVIDPGHGGKDPGAIGINGTFEKDINLLFAKIIRSVLSSSNIKVKLTRTDDRYLYLRERINFAEKLKAIFLYQFMLMLQKIEKPVDFLFLVYLTKLLIKKQMSLHKEKISLTLLEDLRFDILIH